MFIFILVIFFLGLIILKINKEKQRAKKEETRLLSDISEAKDFFMESANQEYNQIGMVMQFFLKVSLAERSLGAADSLIRDLDKIFMEFACYKHYLHIPTTEETRQARVIQFYDVFESIEKRFSEEPTFEKGEVAKSYSEFLERIRRLKVLVSALEFSDFPDDSMKSFVRRMELWNIHASQATSYLRNLKIKFFENGIELDQNTLDFFGVDESITKDIEFLN